MGRAVALALGLLWAVSYPLLAIPESGSAQLVWVFTAWLVAIVFAAGAGRNG